MSKLTLFTAILLSGIAEYFSIVGLIAIFAAAPISIAVMGAALGVSKLVAASWVYRNWDHSPRALKYYLTLAVVVLSIITSMGIFGFLSKAHSEQTLVSNDLQAKLLIYDEKIKTARENIDADRKQLKQLDEAVDQIMARSTTEEGASKSVAVRRAQNRDRIALAKNIEANQKLIASLNEEAAPLRAEVRKVEAEVGPIKYIAALIYGDNPDVLLLEKAIRWVTVIIVLVFDPLAILLLIAANITPPVKKEEEEPPVKVTPVTPVSLEPAIIPAEESIPSVEHKLNHKDDVTIKENVTIEKQSGWRKESFTFEDPSDAIKIDKERIHEIKDDMLNP